MDLSIPENLVPFATSTARKEHVRKDQATCQFNAGDGNTFIDEYDDVESILSIKFGAEDLQSLDADLQLSDFCDDEEEGELGAKDPNSVSHARTDTAKVSPRQERGTYQSETQKKGSESELTILSPESMLVDEFDITLSEPSDPPRLAQIQERPNHIDKQNGVRVQSESTPAFIEVAATDHQTPTIQLDCPTEETEASAVNIKDIADRLKMLVNLGSGTTQSPAYSQKSQVLNLSTIAEEDTRNLSRGTDLGTKSFTGQQGLLVVARGESDDAGVPHVKITEATYNSSSHGVGSSTLGSELHSSIDGTSLTKKRNVVRLSVPSSGHSSRDFSLADTQSSSVQQLQKGSDDSRNFYEKDPAVNPFGSFSVTASKSPTSFGVGEGFQTPCNGFRGFNSQETSFAAADIGSQAKEDFFDSKAGRQLIDKDEEALGKANQLERSLAPGAELSTGGLSHDSWGLPKENTFMSKPSWMSGKTDKTYSRISIGNFMRGRSEPLGSLDRTDQETPTLGLADTLITPPRYKPYKLLDASPGSDSDSSGDKHTDSPYKPIPETNDPCASRNHANADVSDSDETSFRDMAPRDIVAEVLRELECESGARDESTTRLKIARYNNVLSTLKKQDRARLDADAAHRTDAGSGGPYRTDALGSGSPHLTDAAGSGGPHRTYAPGSGGPHLTDVAGSGGPYRTYAPGSGGPYRMDAAGSGGPYRMDAAGISGGPYLTDAAGSGGPYRMDAAGSSGGPYRMDAAGSSGGPYRMDAACSGDPYHTDACGDAPHQTDAGSDGDTLDVTITVSSGIDFSEAVTGADVSLSSGSIPSDIPDLTSSSDDDSSYDGEDEGKGYRKTLDTSKNGKHEDDSYGKTRDGSGDWKNDGNRYGRARDASVDWENDGERYGRTRDAPGGGETDWGTGRGTRDASGDREDSRDSVGGTPTTRLDDDAFRNLLTRTETKRLSEPAPADSIEFDESTETASRRDALPGRASVHTPWISGMSKLSSAAGSAALREGGQGEATRPPATSALKDMLLSLRCFQEIRAEDERAAADIPNTDQLAVDPASRGQALAAKYVAGTMAGSLESTAAALALTEFPGGGSTEPDAITNSFEKEGLQTVVRRISHISALDSSRAVPELNLPAKSPRGAELALATASDCYDDDDAAVAGGDVLTWLSSRGDYAAAEHDSYLLSLQSRLLRLESANTSAQNSGTEGATARRDAARGSLPIVFDTSEIPEFEEGAYVGTYRTAFSLPDALIGGRLLPAERGGGGGWPATSRVVPTTDSGQLDAGGPRASLTGGRQVARRRRSTR
ncbi:PREDICTED: dentin sialophosphoprotein-like isoform X3 [Priapulus caudatus]|uniref:Dentin sialophosphoprotein-like isoform X3 n=1 Tax=Priapulus caudatus TaxID=37621 RepID=A0ABM1EHB1_PRICU|nr:PREDICTED: dentin sialophosphoprotein-like isoform X3 [Priapulus caudatus]